MAARDFSLDGTRQAGASTGATWGDQLKDEGPTGDLEACVLDDQERQVVRRQATDAMAHLNPKERYILVHRLMCDEPQTLQQIGVHFSISRERARQIESAVKRKMSHALKHLAPGGNTSRAA